MNIKTYFNVVGFLVTCCLCTVGCSTTSTPNGVLSHNGKESNVLIGDKKIADEIYDIAYKSRNAKLQAFANIPNVTKPLNVVVYLHGGDTLPGNPHDYQDAWTAQVASQVYWKNAIALFPNYQGYGTSSGHVGSPYDDYIDASNAIKALSELKNIRLTGNIYVFGISLGGFVALKMASTNPNVKAVALDSPFPGGSTIVKWAKQEGKETAISYANGYLETYGKADSIGYVENSVDYSKVTVPVLIIGGKNDQTIPPSLLRYLYKNVKKSSKDVELQFMNAGHAPNNPTEYGMVVNWFSENGVDG